MDCVLHGAFCFWKKDLSLTSVSRKSPPKSRVAAHLSTAGSATTRILSHERWRPLALLGRCPLGFEGFGGSSHCLNKVSGFKGKKESVHVMQVGVGAAPGLVSSGSFFLSTFSSCLFFVRLSPS